MYSLLCCFVFLLLNVRVIPVFAFKKTLKLCAGADVNIADIDGESAFHCAATF